MRKHLSLLAVLAVALVGTAHGASNFYGFDAATAATEFDVVDMNAAVAGTNSAEFGFDYSAYSVGEAPNTPTGAAATRGLSFGVNLVAPGKGSAISAFPKVAAPTGTYRMQVDVYPYKISTSASSEEFMIGWNHTGTKALWAGVDVGANTDGYYTIWGVDVNWFGYGLYKGGNDISFDNVPGLTWADGTEANNPERVYSDAWVKTVLAPDGYWANKWGTVTFVVDGNLTQVFYNAIPVCTYSDPATTYTSGKIGVGAQDMYASVNAVDRYIFDNLRIENVTATVADWSQF